MPCVGFFNLASLLHPHAESQVTVMCEPVSVETQLAVTFIGVGTKGAVGAIAPHFL